MSRRVRVLCSLAVVFCGALAVAGPAEDRAAQILQATGLRGGLIVHVGCGDGKLTAALGAKDGYAVHGLDVSAENVAQAAEHIRAAGLYGKVSVDRFDGKHLPYVDNLVNLVVAEDLGAVGRPECLRVLCPNGVAYVQRDGKWTKTLKPRPGTIDDWTHYLYDPSNSAVSKDMQVAPPRHMQWLAGPRYSRHHDHMSGASAMVTAGGRLFAIFDHASPQAVQLPSRWFLVARDAFSGTLLWRRPIEHWHTQMFRLKSGPAQLTRRLVAVGQRVYVTPGLEAPVSVLDAATGKTLGTYEGTAGTEEILVHDGLLLAMINDKPFRQPGSPKEYVYTWPQGPRRIAAYDAETAQALWNRPQPTVLPLTMCADDARVVFHDGERVACLDRKTGRDLWRSQPLGWRRPLPTSFAPTLVLYRDVVLFSGGGKGGKSNAFRPGGNTIVALSASDGKELWRAPHPPSGHRTAQDALVVGGLVWLPTIAQGKDSGEIIGHDPHTGQVTSRFLPDVKTHWFHHRCYRAKATERYLLTSRTGIEFVDPKTKHWEINHWVRGGCLYGVMPANGMVYNPPHPCACYLEAKLYGFNALAPASPSRQVPKDVPDAGRLQRGPAYGQIAEPADQGPQDWPTLRHDAQRSGCTKTAVPPRLAPAWESEIGGRLSAPVVAGGRVYVAQIDLHTVWALDAAAGKRVWSFRAGGRVDSPPTVWKGRVLFGSADGYVYCLRAKDGELAWRFRAAPLDRRHMAFEQMESVWPVHGSVLVLDRVLYCAAGRCRFLDGGLRLLKLDAADGRKLGEVVLDARDPASGQDLQAYIKGLNMPVALPDVLVSDGKWLYMKSQRFDLRGVVQDIDVPTRNVTEQTGEYQHLFCPTGLLDDVWWHRSYWVFGRVWKSGAGGYHQAGRVAPAGRPLVIGDTTVYGYGRLPQFYRWTTPMEYQLFATAKQPEILRMSGPGAAEKGPARRPKAAKRPADERKLAKRKRPRAGAAPNTRIAMHWTQEIPILVRGMVLAGKVLFVAGPPDVVDERQSLTTFQKALTQKQLARQAAALEGAEGAILRAVSAEDGRGLAESKLPSPPVFDGLIAANGRLYLATIDGKVRCLAGK